MKRNLSKLIVLAIFIVCFCFINCDEPPRFIVGDRPDMELIDLTIQPIKVINGVPSINPDAPAVIIETIPEPVIDEDWDDINFMLTEAESEEAWFLVEEHTETARIVTRVTPGMVVKWGIGTSGSRPLSFGNPSEPQPFVDNDFIYIQVSTRNEHYRKYYRIHARMASPVSLISVISIADRETEISYNAGRPEWNDVKVSGVAEIPLSIALQEGLRGSDIIITKMDDNSSVEFATVQAGLDYSNMNISQLNFSYKEGDEIIQVPDPETGENVPTKGVHIIFGDQDLLIAKVTAQNTVDTQFYKFRVSVGRIATIKNLELDTDLVLGLGIPNEAWGNSIVAGSYGTATQTESGLNIKIITDDPDAKAYVAKVLSVTETVIPAFDGNFNAQGVYGSTIRIENKEVLAIRIDSASELTPGTASVSNYYKVRIDMLPAVINKQPVSAAYHVINWENLPRTLVTDDGIDYQRILVTTPGITGANFNPPLQKLKVEVSKEIADATYQWYTANSWYGGYGFDRDGNIVGDPDAVRDGYHPNTDRRGLDEKNNVSLHNGGNNFYRVPIGYPLDAEKKDYDYANRNKYGGNTSGSQSQAAQESEYSGWLPYPAVKIPPELGGNDAELDLERWMDGKAKTRPFIAGFSNQTQYFWVVIRDSRGYQVESERATIVSEWGEVFDLGVPTGRKIEKKHHVVDLNVDLKLPKKNVAPFTYQREHYIIPISFPAGFDILDYSVATCQAIFYLADGRPWIQNWTQGDIYLNIDGNRIVGYYNLTNNNSTLGLSGDSRDPQGASIYDNPTDVVIAPSGEKPVRRVPPFLSDGITPVNINDAQGWFTPYIEIVELRFEGPRRERP